MPVVFEPGDTRQCFNVVLLSDDQLEDTEQFRLILQETEDNMGFDPPTTIVNILSDGWSIYILMCVHKTLPLIPWQVKL